MDYMKIARRNATVRFNHTAAAAVSVFLFLGVTVVPVLQNRDSEIVRYYV